MALVVQLHEIVNELEAMHQNRRFALDGHLVGSIGEAAAEAMFDLELERASSRGYDAISNHRKVEIKATYGTRGVSVRRTSEEVADSLIVIRLSRCSGVEHEVVFNGPLSIARRAAGTFQKNGQAHMSLVRLRELDGRVPTESRIPRRVAPTK